MTNQSIDALVLAGSRPAGDPMADAYGVSVKALVPVAGQPMLAHVLRGLLDSPVVAGIRVLAQKPQLIMDDPDCGQIMSDQRVVSAESAASIAATIDAQLANEDTRYPLLVTTADNVLLDASTIDDFVAKATGSEIAIGVVERSVLIASYPASKRTWLKFRSGHFSGANLFYFGSPKASVILRYWAEVEQDRKKGWKILTIFGPWLLFLVLTRMLTIDQFAKRVANKLNLNIGIVQMPQAEACIDVDKEADLVLVEQILKNRRS